jgi:hypothetical protein
MSTKNKSASGGKKNILNLLILSVVVVGAIFFGSWIRHLNNQTIGNLFQKTSDTILTKTESSEELSKKQVLDSGIIYTDEERGFRLAIPKDGRRYAVKEIEPREGNMAVLFGLPLIDSEVKRVKKEAYSEIFRIELVPRRSLGKKVCADKRRQFPLCDPDDRELGRNDQFVFIYKRYDKLTEVEKSNVKLIPSDFDVTVFTQADEISKSFRLILAQNEAMDKKI